MPCVYRSQHIIYSLFLPASWSISRGARTCSRGTSTCSQWLRTTYLSGQKLHGQKYAWTKYFTAKNMHARGLSVHFLSVQFFSVGWYNIRFYTFIFLNMLHIFSEQAQVDWSGRYIRTTDSDTRLYFIFIYHPRLNMCSTCSANIVLFYVLFLHDVPILFNDTM